MFIIKFATLACEKNKYLLQTKMSHDQEWQGEAIKKQTTAISYIIEVIVLGKV